VPGRVDAADLGCRCPVQVDLAGEALAVDRGGLAGHADVCQAHDLAGHDGVAGREEGRAGGE